MIIPRVGDAASLKGKYMQPQPLSTHYHKARSNEPRPPLPPYPSWHQAGLLLRRYEKNVEDTRRSALIGFKIEKSTPPPPNGVMGLDNYAPDFTPEKLSGVLYSSSI